jgi:Transcriptional regulators
MEDFELIVKFKTIKNKFYSLMDKKLDQLGLTKSEFWILNYIYSETKEGNKVQASSIAKVFEVSIPAVMHKLEPLEMKGMLIKEIDFNDKRIKYYRISRKMAEAVELLFLEHQKEVGKYLDFLGKEQVHLNKILNLTLNFLEENHD